MEETDELIISFLNQFVMQTLNCFKTAFLYVVHQLLLIVVFAASGYSQDFQDTFNEKNGREEYINKISTKDYHLVDIYAGEFEDCSFTIPRGHYVLAESFFRNFDYVIRRVALLRAYGFEEATYIHSRCQSLDVDKPLYIVLIKKPVKDKTELYSAISNAYRKAVNANIKLINTRIVLAQ